MLPLMKWLRNIEFFLLTKVKMPFVIQGFFASLACFLLKRVSGACFSIVSKIAVTNISKMSLNLSRWKGKLDSAVFASLLCISSQYVLLQNFLLSR